MISRLGLAISRVFERSAPDPFVIAILLTVLTAGLALSMGRFPAERSSFFDPTEVLLDSWRFAEVRNGEVVPAQRLGVWKLLEFSMQMCLILVTGHALAVTRPMRALIDAVAGLPRSTGGAAALVSFCACATALLNWGLGLIAGALLAREVGRSLEKRGIRAHYPLIVAAGYMGLMVWHGGLSGSAPLAMTTPSGANAVLPPQALEALSGKGIGLDQTLFSPMNLVITLGLLAIVPAVFAMLAPKRESDIRPISEFELAPELPVVLETNATLPARLERSPVVVWILAVMFAAGLVRFAQTSGLRAIGLNEVNAAMLALGLVMHGSARAYMAAAEQGARGCAGIIIQFPLYAGIMAMMQESQLVNLIADRMNQWGNQTTIPLMSFVSASIINLFIPSGGGQWAVQGPIAMQAAMDANIPPGKMVMSVAYGDQLTNMLQPFWALPLLAITGVKARDIVGYTCLVMLVAAVWIGLGLILF